MGSISLEINAFSTDWFGRVDMLMCASSCEVFFFSKVGCIIEFLGRV